MGLWKGAGDAPRGSLYRVGWAPHGEPHVEVVALRAARGGDERVAGEVEADVEAGEPAVVEELTARVGPAFPGLSLKLVDKSFAILKDEPWKRDVRRGAAAAGGTGNAAGGGDGAGGSGSGAGPGGGGGGPSRPSAAALAAAAVATGGCGDGELLGASPPRSFGYEVLRFMAAHIAGSRSSSRKSRSRGGGGGAGSAGPYGGGGGCSGGAARQATILKHLVRLQVPAPSRQRPVSGLWTGVYGPHGMEIISVGYDGRGGEARIVATKITGDPNVPAGEITFRAHPEPLPQPWPLSEVELITNRPLFSANRAAALAAAVAAAAADAVAEQEQRLQRPVQGVLALPVWAMPGVAAAVQAVVPEAGGVQDVNAPIEDQLAAVAAEAAAADPVDPWDYLGPQGLSEHMAVAATALGLPLLPCPSWRDKKQASRVVAVYRGEGRVAGTNFRNPAWIDGRLWVYDNGTIGFLWRGDFNFLVDLDRMSVQLMERTNGPVGSATAGAL
ncbi:hypothetical protein VOLCADRAFT_120169 [Volvox carteri f. nagariensis]|uniref:Uncharacterized protein n=1 Tax=Volvox carteri f. nagariensis TaxID=3068 RepID=D8THF9_VOLCA|nr:uncharacterized protein VOLCADRAFT_120169 [Volvox carteri f. nagariensis]EFJ53064.1 hypothetical protein VOLCADRAFT_120169 [Volvox carteri f. nagariensis]|eukprot:XP_002946069.1 hypothetical protein VOLCADRAFT_120169 [Volvox carteri f. nagariensis]